MKPSQEHSKASNGAKLARVSNTNTLRNHFCSKNKQEFKKERHAKRRENDKPHAGSFPRCLSSATWSVEYIPSTLPLPTKPPPSPPAPFPNIITIIIPIPAPQTITLQSRRRRNMSHARTRRDGKPRAQTRHDLARSSGLWVRRRRLRQRRQRASRVASDRVYRQASRRCDHLEGTSDLGVQLGVEEIVVRV